MKKIIAVAALAALAACSEPAPEPDTAATEAAAPAAAETVTTLAADGQPSTGKFEVTLKDGSKIVADVKPDGTFELTDSTGKVVDSGTWEQKSPEQYCETSSKEGSKEICYIEKFENGVYTSTNPDTGETATVVRLEG